MKDSATSAGPTLGGSYFAGQSQPLAKVVAEAPAWGVGAISVTYRVRDGKLQTWASTYRKGSGWETLAEPLNALVEEMVAILIPLEQSGWGQLDIDVAKGSATVALVQSEKEDVATLV